MGPAIAHTFVSFAFAGGDHLAISIETRKEKGEAYSTIKGFFRQYELYYVVADERDVIRSRTNYRKDPPEDVYVYRVQGPVENGRRLFMEYMNQINALKTRPDFYNTLINNCTTDICTTPGSTRNICASTGRSSPAATCRTTSMNQGGLTPACPLPNSSGAPTSTPARRRRTRRRIFPG